MFIFDLNSTSSIIPKPFNIKKKRRGEIKEKRLTYFNLDEE